MKLLTISLLLFLIINQAFGSATEKYNTKYDGINLNEILASERLLTGYVKCLLDEGPCTPDGKELKHNLPDAIENDCAKCTKRQQEGADQVMHYIIDNRPADWDKLEQKYNSDGSYKNKYLEGKEGTKQKSTEETNDVRDPDDGDAETDE